MSELNQDDIDPPAPTTQERETHRLHRFRTEIAQAINRVSMEDGSDTPDFILAEYLVRCLDAFDRATMDREKWYGRKGSVAFATLHKRRENS